ncbi:c-type cytochrome [sulfur-oxidizing endosymbiont of Gigantopelta aegis]|uniref:c-type cytochrome n=1 Tax=sulfur-oxidizing endosymbiont of Gigantopelta aegis TaxID=2794934 RepID=UPI0018DC2A4E|nr:cytochrome c [sulfur-oxidizing endosymbiont of Gigantopelta aegis]
MQQRAKQDVKLTVCFVILLVISSVFSSPVIANETQAVSVERQDELKYMVQQDCGSCHGMTLKGGLGPSLLPERISVLPTAYLIEAISHGREGTPMPPWKPILTKNEIKWIVEQLQSGNLGQKK